MLTKIMILNEKKFNILLFFLQDFTTGATCNQCKAHTFYLNPRNPHGCISCFCSGVTQQCDSSRWYRSQVSAAFARDTQGVKLGEASSGRIIDSGIHVDTELRELIYQDFSRRNPEVYHWMLPPSFLGNKVTSYGGYLNYTVRYVPTPGGQSSRNNAPDVELISVSFTYPKMWFVSHKLIVIVTFYQSRF